MANLNIIFEGLKMKAKMVDVGTEISIAEHRHNKGFRYLNCEEHKGDCQEIICIECGESVEELI